MHKLGESIQFSWLLRGIGDTHNFFFLLKSNFQTSKLKEPDLGRYGVILGGVCWWSVSHIIPSNIACFFNSFNPPEAEVCHSNLEVYYYNLEVCYSNLKVSTRNLEVCYINLEACYSYL